MFTRGVAQLAPQAYLALNLADAERLELAPGDVVDLQLGPQTLALTMRIMPSLSPGVVGLPVGLPDLPYVQLPARGRLSPQERREP